MVDKLTSERRSANMARIRSKDMKPEMAVRRLVHGMGFRYRLHCRDLPGKPDLVFPARRKIIFVHGCFWHQHPDPECRDARPPRSNTDYWGPKLQRNAERDAQHQRLLEADRWRVLIVWECELKKPEPLADRLREFLLSDLV